MKRFTRRQVLYLILILIVIIFLLPFKLNYRFEVTAIVFPIQEWHLSRGQDDSFVSEFQDYKTDVFDHIKSYKFNRGDISEVRIREGLTAGSLVQSGDTIAHIHSYYIANELIRLRSLLAVESKTLKVESSGQKQELIEQAIQEYNLAKQQFDLEEKRYIRQKKLFADSIIASESFEISENAYKLATINIEIARQEMFASQSGGKPENIELVLQRIESLNREISSLEELQAQYYIIPPIAGLVSYHSVENEIISISDTNGFILKIPVMLRDLSYLKRIQAIRFSVPGRSEEIDAEFISVEGNVKLMDSRQMVIARALIKEGQTAIYPGMTVKCQVICDEISLFNYMKRGMKLNF